MRRYIQAGEFNFSMMFSYTATIYHKQFPLLLLLVFITQAVVNIPLAAGVIPEPDAITWDWLAANMGWLVLWALASFLTLVLLHLAAIKVTISTVNEQEIGLGDAFHKAFADFLPATLLQVLIAVVILAALLLPLLVLYPLGGWMFTPLFVGLLSVAALVIGVYLIFSLQAMAVKGYGVFDALGRSWRAVRGQWWRVFGYSLGLGAAVAIANYVVEHLLQLIPYVGHLFALYATNALTVFSVIAMTLFFLHLDHRLAD